MTSSHLRVAVCCLLFLGILVAAGDRARAIPRFSLISGTRCSACHFNPQGGGLRTELGWDSMNETGAWQWPWSPKKADAIEESDEDLFNAPGETPAEGTTPFEEAPADTASATPTDELPTEDVPEDGSTSETDVVDDFEAADPLPAHEPTEVVEETPATAVPDGADVDVDGSPSTASAEDFPTAPVEVHTNSMFDGLLTPGVDIRLQMTKIGRPPNDRRIVFPMQTQVYLAATPVDWLAVYGGVNASAIDFGDAVTRRRYPGQSSWEATAQFHPGVTLPTVRVGYMQPSIGIRHDDHTMFTRRDVAGSAPVALIPPGYAELGVEATYEGMSWLTVNAGVFGSHNLSEIVPDIGTVTSITDLSKPSVLARVMLWPQDLDLGFNGELGASYFGNGDFQMINVFGGLGLSDRGSFLVEALMADYPGARRVRNVSVMGSYQLFTWLSLDWRYEWAQGEDSSSNELVHAQQAVFGVEFFPFPNVELRPEYRFFQTEPFAQTGGYLQGQYTLQLHLYY